MAEENVQEVNMVYCPRERWCAEEPRPFPPARPVNHPVEFVRVGETGSVTCNTPAECFRVLQLVQRRDMEEKRLMDINYNFLVGGDGTVYEGRGWHKDVDTDEEEFLLESNCIHIAYIGNTKDKAQVDAGYPTPACEMAVYNFITKGQQSYFIRTTYKHLTGLDYVKNFNVRQRPTDFSP